MGKLTSAGYMPNPSQFMRFDRNGAQAAFNEAIKTIGSSSLGSTLIHEIEERENVVEIWPAGPLVDSTCYVAENLAGQCCYKEVLSDAELCNEVAPVVRTEELIS